MNRCLSAPPRSNPHGSEARADSRLRFQLRRRKRTTSWQPPRCFQRVPLFPVYVGATGLSSGMLCLKPPTRHPPELSSLLFSSSVPPACMGARKPGPCASHHAVAVYALWRGEPPHTLGDPTSDLGSVVGDAGSVSPRHGRPHIGGRVRRLESWEIPRLCPGALRDTLGDPTNVVGSAS